METILLLHMNTGRCFTTHVMTIIFCVCQSNLTPFVGTSSEKRCVKPCKLQEPAWARPFLCLLHKRPFSSHSSWPHVNWVHYTIYRSLRLFLFGVLDDFLLCSWGWAWFAQWRLWVDHWFGCPWSILYPAHHFGLHILGHNRGTRSLLLCIHKLCSSSTCQNSNSRTNLTLRMSSFLLMAVGLWWCGWPNEWRRQELSQTVEYFDHSRNSQLSCCMSSSSHHPSKSNHF